ncbi:class I SAM-dependent methyltransferase [Chromobacterium haemolyticum]|uniref:Methyltransferase domain-containing protein n=1 Tax=Chromobacterium haemolyticum TaxID=394935 RepID=A0A1W0D6U0_9NEIS|nr:class I SAM-dependent methyltransferase [Chromobacterium haemolyticum]OQS42710.1 hypothetical protein B0T45_04905 [Chromobacterium haemolyticum]
MSFSNEWELAFQSGGHHSIWPWSDLISLYKRYARYWPSRPRVLELGCGVGANIPFFLAEKAEYFAIEGSAAAVRRLCERFPHLAPQLVHGDFIHHLPFKGEFDLIVDRAAMTHNSTDSILRAVQKLASILKPGGIYLGVDWFSTSHAGYGSGLPAEDVWTRQGYEDGPFAGVGKVHFSDREHLKTLFAGWDWLALEEKKIIREIPVADTLATWNFVARKP